MQGDLTLFALLNGAVDGIFQEALPMSRLLRWYGLIVGVHTADTHY